MNTKALEDFVEENSPVKVALNATDIKALAAKAGLEVLSASKGRVFLSKGNRAVVVWGEEKIPNDRSFDYIEFKPDDGIVVTWMASVSGDHVTYAPFVPSPAAGGFGKCPRASEVLIKAAGLGPVVVKLPEKAVTLPRAPWDQSFAADWGSGMVEDTVTCYVSEAAALVIPFVRHLAEIASLKIAVE